MTTTRNLDHAELDKFAASAPRWWDPQGDMKPLHELNPLRVAYIAERAKLDGARVADVGCGGGILSEALAKRGAHVTGIEASADVAQVAKMHLLESKLPIDYHCTTVEEFAAGAAGQFDVVTCMEMLEHVPDPASAISACARLLKPGGHLFVSTLNRHPKAFLFAIVGAEYVLRMLPAGTHHYGQFIQPAELDEWLRSADMTLRELTGVSYNALLRRFDLSRDVRVNYLAHAVK